MTRFPLHSFYSMGFHNRIDQTVPRMVAEFSSTLGMIFPLVFFQVQIKLKVFFTEINFTENKWLICKSYNLLKSNISNHLHLKPLASFGQRSRQLLWNLWYYYSFKRLQFRIPRSPFEWFLWYLQFKKPSEKANLL